MPPPSSEDVEANGETRPLLSARNGSHHSRTPSGISNMSVRETGLAKYIYRKVLAVLLGNYVNALLVFVPLGIVAGALGWSDTVIFALNFLAIVPLAALLSFATEDLALHVGETLGGLLNATFGNAVELIVSQA